MGEVVALISPSPIAFSLVGEDWVGGEMRRKVGGKGGSLVSPSPIAFSLVGKGGRRLGRRW